MADGVGAGATGGVALSSTGGGQSYNTNWLGAYSITSSQCESSHCCCFAGDVTVSQGSITINGHDQPQLVVQSAIHGDPCGGADLAYISLAMPNAGVDSIVFTFTQAGNYYNMTLQGGATPNAIMIYQVDRPLCYALAKLDASGGGGDNKAVIIGCVVAGVVVLLLAVGYFYYRRKKAESPATQDGFAPLYNP